VAGELGAGEDEGDGGAREDEGDDDFAVRWDLGEESVEISVSSTGVSGGGMGGGGREALEVRSG
jgi:hypothetical protein